MELMSGAARSSSESLERHVHAGYAEGLDPELRHGPHAYLAPLLTDKGRSTMGPQGWEPQQRELMSVSGTEQGKSL